MPLTLDAVVLVAAAVPSDITEASIVALLDAGLRAEAASGDWSLEVLFTSDDAMQALHRQFMGDDSPTDILTFGDDPLPGGPPGRSGQIAISVDQAAAQAGEYGHSVSDELRFLVLHGILHLAGWDDDTDIRRAAMLARQSEMLAAFNAG